MNRTKSTKRQTGRFVFLAINLIGIFLLSVGIRSSNAQQGAPLTFQLSTVDAAGTAKTSFYLGEAVSLKFAVTNVSGTPQTITTLDQAAMSLKLSSRINGEEGPVVRETFRGGRFGARTAHGVELLLEGAPTDTTLAPGQTVQVLVDLSSTFGIRLDDGSYTLNVVYSPALQAQADFTIAIDEPRTIPVLEQMAANGNEGDQRWANSYLDLIRKPSISGRVTNPTGGPVGGVSFSITGAQTTTLSNLSDGTYRLTQLASGGNYTLTPSLEGYTFAPATRAFNNLTTKQVDVNFTATKAQTGENVALKTAGAVATASSTFDDDYPADSAINGFTYGDWGTGSGGWMDGTPGVFADSIEIDFGGPKGIDWINVYTLQDNFQNSNEPTLAETFTLYGITGFDVQYWNGSAWLNVPGGQVDGNNNVWRQFTFPTITTSKIKVNVRAAQGGQSRITEIQAFHTNKPPTVSIPGTYQGAPGAAIQFASTAADVDGSIQSYSWDFGDNASGTGPSPSHAYAVAGTYTVTLTVTDDTGQTATATKTVSIAGAPQSPVASAGGPYTGFPGTSIIFDGRGSFDPDGTIVSYQWNFGDGASAPGAAPSHSYAQSGNYTATLVVTDNSGSTASQATAVTIAIAVPIVTMTAPASGTVVLVGSTVRLSASVSSADPISSVQFFLGTTLLGNGTLVTPATTPSTYFFDWTNVPAGNYAITAKATKVGGGVGTSAPVNITVSAPPTVAITAPVNNATFAPPASITVTANAAASNGDVSKVEFFQGATKIGEDNSAPYSTPWNNVPSGSYQLTAKVTDSNNFTATSAAVTVVVNTLPTVSITSPTVGQVFSAPANVGITIVAADADGTVSKVEIYKDATLLGEATWGVNSLYFNWMNVPAGNYNLTAKATDNRGAVTTSAAVNVIINAPPTVSITSPTAGQIFSAPANVGITIVAADADGTVSKVEIYKDATLLGEATWGVNSLYFNWMNVPAGNYSLTAKATDNRGAVTTSAAINVIVNAAPTVAITAPANNAMFTPGENIQISTSASDSDGSISKVEIYQGATLLGQASSGINYIYVWTNVAVGTYTVTAKATDNRGAVTTSAPINIIVNAPPTVAITAPANNTTFAPGENIQMTISASDTGGGSISKVEIYQGATLLGQASSGINYIFVWANVAAGTYTLTAKATDNNGAVTTSAPISVTVSDPAPPASLVFGDDFNDNSLDATKWTVTIPNSTAVVSEQGGRLQIALPPHEAAYNGISSIAAYDLRGRTVQLELAQPISQAGWVENYLQVILDSQNYYLINVGAGTLLFRSMVNGANDQTAIAFDQTATRYWRIRHDAAANTVNFETSPNAVSWTTRKTVTPGFSLAAVKFNLMSGAWGTGNNIPGIAKYDNFQLFGATSQNSATFVQIDDATQGNWNGVYGSGGYSIAHTSGDMTSLPAAEMSMTGQTPFLWALASSDPRALQKPAGQKGRIVSCWYSATNFTIDLNLTDNLEHQVALYGLDWDGGNRSIRVEVIDATTNAVLDTRDLTAYFSGAYMVWNLKGHLLLRVTKLAGPNAAISGLFID